MDRVAHDLGREPDQAADSGRRETHDFRRRMLCEANDERSAAAAELPALQGKECPRGSTSAVGCYRILSTFYGTVPYPVPVRYGT